MVARYKTLAPAISTKQKRRDSATASCLYRRRRKHKKLLAELSRLPFRIKSVEDWSFSRLRTEVVLVVSSPVGDLMILVNSEPGFTMRRYSLERDCARLTTVPLCNVASRLLHYIGTPSMKIADSVRKGASRVASRSQHN